MSDHNEHFDENAFIARFDRFMKRHEESPPSESPVTRLQALVGLLLMLVLGGIAWGSFKTGTERDVQGLRKDVDAANAGVAEFTARKAQIDELIHHPK